MRALAGTLVLIGLAFAYMNPGLLSLDGQPGAGYRESPQAALNNQKNKVLYDDGGDRQVSARSVTSNVSPPDIDLVRVSAATVRAADGQSTVFSMDLSRGLTAEVFTLADPYRVVIDMPEVVFALAPGTGQEGAGLVRAFRYGLFDEGQGRVVLDTRGPTRIETARMVRRAGGERDGVRFEIRLVPMAASAFGQGTGAGTLTSAYGDGSRDTVKPVEKPARSRPVVVIDPGHGGIDPGAVAPSDVYEKDVVLAVSLVLRDALVATGHYEVRLTRQKDVFVPLDKRLALSRLFHADLFLSIHADSVAEETAAHAVSGATVYTLSDRASDEQARLMAEKENASDLLAGISPDDVDGPANVSSILIDLMQRESSNFSTDFSNLLVSKLSKRVKLARKPQRSAAFKVLKQTHAPSVLIELGYLTNPGDEKLLRSAVWQAKVADAITEAVKSYFSKRSALRR